MSILECIVTALCAVLASSGFWLFVQKNSDKNDAKTQLLIGLANDRIVSLGMCYIRRGRISSEEYENLNTYLYKPYSEIYKNGSAARIMQEVDKIPLREIKYRRGVCKNETVKQSV